jgi:hypothetical protein
MFLSRYHPVQVPVVSPEPLFDSGHGLTRPELPKIHSRNPLRAGSSEASSEVLPTASHHRGRSLMVKGCFLLLLFTAFHPTIQGEENGVNRMIEEGVVTDLAIADSTCPCQKLW